MGLTCTKIKTIRRNLKKKTAKVTVQTSNGKLENRPSSEILRELQDDGMFTKLRKSGCSYTYERTDGKKKYPRRLPKLVHKPKSNSVGDIVYTAEEKSLMVEIRRRDNLESKGKMAKLHKEKREKVMERKRKIKALEAEKNQLEVLNKKEKKLEKQTETEKGKKLNEITGKKEELNG